MKKTLSLSRICFKDQWTPIKQEWKKDLSKFNADADLQNITLKQNFFLFQSPWYGTKIHRNATPSKYSMG
jgi:hypothetical protein